MFINDDEKNDYEESNMQMKKTIKIMHDQESSTPWVNYIKDVGLAFGKKENLDKKDKI